MATAKKWTNSQGKTFVLTPIPPVMLNNVMVGDADDSEWGAKPQPPTYTIEETGETLFHNKTTLETDEEKAQWAEYEQRLAYWTGMQTTRMLRLIAFKGMQIPEEDYALDSDWAEEMKFLGVRVPEANRERKVAYAYSEAFASQEDMNEIMVTCFELSGVDKAALRSMREMFRSQL